MAAHPSELWDEIEDFRRHEAEQRGAAEARYLNSHGPYIEARDEALALLPKLADAIEKATAAYADAAYRSLVNLGVEPDQCNPDRSDISQCATASRGQRYVKKNKPAPPTSIYKAAVHRCARAVRRSGNVNADRHAYGPDRQPGRAGLRAAKGVRCERNSDSRKT